MSRLLFVCLPLVAIFLAITGHWQYTWTYGPSDNIGKLCHQVALDFNWDSSHALADDIGWRHLNVDGLNKFIQECRDVYATLATSQRDVLEPLLGAPLVEEVRLPKSKLPGYEDKRKRAFYDARGLVTAKPVYDQSVAEALTEKVRSIVTEHINSTGIQEPAWLNGKEIPTPNGTYNKLDIFIGFSLVHLGGLSMMDWAKTIDTSQVRSALQYGLVSKIDTTHVIPRELLNVTMTDLVRMQGGNVPVQWRGSWPYRCSMYMSLKYNMIPFGEKIFCPPPVELGQFAGKLPPSGAKVSLRRMNKVFDLDGKLLEAFNLTTDIERSEGQLWFGTAGGGIHWDEPDNVIVCLSGNMVILTHNPNFTDALYGSKSVFNMGLGIEAINYSHVPSYITVLRPGEGLVIPSRTYHSVFATEDRIAFSTFLEPRWGHMKWSSNPGSYLHYASTERIALRNVLVQSAARLWDKWGIGMFQQEGIEYL